MEMINADEKVKVLILWIVYVHQIYIVTRYRPKVQLRVS